MRHRPPRGSADRILAKATQLRFALRQCLPPLEQPALPFPDMPEHFLRTVYGSLRFERLGTAIGLEAAQLPFAALELHDGAPQIILPARPLASESTESGHGGSRGPIKLLAAVAALDRNRMLIAVIARISAAAKTSAVPVTHTLIGTGTQGLNGTPSYPCPQPGR